MAPTNALSDDILLVDVPPPADEQWIAKIESKYPGLRVRWIARGWTLSPEPLPKEAFDGVTMMMTMFPHPAELLPKVRYIQLISAGADLWITHEKYKDPNVIFCTSNGTHPPQIAEWVIGTWLMMGHHFLTYAQQQKDGIWKPLFRELQIHDSPGMRMGILGYGAIGRQCARLGQALGMEVYAYTRSEKPTPESRKDDSYCVPGTGDPDGLIPTRWFHGASKEAVNEFLGQDLDILVISLPLTEATRHILGRDQFDILSKKKTFVSNVARGGHIDTDALIDALKDGKIRGAALDVVDPEPLPDNHPIMSAPNVFITPHVSWQTPHLFERLQAILEENLERLSKGEKMINVMDREHHY